MKIMPCPVAQQTRALRLVELSVTQHAGEADVYVTDPGLAPQPFIPVAERSSTRPVAP